LAKIQVYITYMIYAASFQKRRFGIFFYSLNHFFLFFHQLVALQLLNSPMKNFVYWSFFRGVIIFSNFKTVVGVGNGTRNHRDWG